MQCPYCKAEIFEGDKFCGHCGQRLVKTENSQAKTDLNIATYIKTLVKSPSQVIETPKLFNTYTIITSIGILLLILALLSFVYYEGFYQNFGISLSIFLRAILIYAGILAAYLIAMIILFYIASSKPVDLSIMIKSYLSLTIIALVFFIISSIFSILSVSYIPLTFNIFALLSLSFGTYYIYKKHVKTEEKIDSFYVLLIHIILVGIVTHLIYNYWINQIFTTAFNF